MDAERRPPITTETGDWCAGSPGLVAWFGVPGRPVPGPDHRTAAALAERVAEIATGRGWPDLDLRADGLQVRLREDDAFTAERDELAPAISGAAAALGMVADRRVPQSFAVVYASVDPTVTSTFWQALLGYDDDLRDPLRHDPPFRFGPLAEPRPLRNRIHVDVAVPVPLARRRQSRVEQLGGRVTVEDRTYHVLVSDPDGNEADLLPVMIDGDRLDGAGVEDWRVLFEAVAFYPTADLAGSVRLASAVALVADEAGVSLTIDVRAAGVRVASGKDRWEDERFPEVARQVQSVARAGGWTADPSPLRFVQLGLDAADVAAVREFWRLVLRYENDPRSHVTDICHPYDLGPPLFVSQIDRSDEARRAQRNRIHLELAVAPDQVRSRVDLAVAAGGRVVDGDEAELRWTIADPEGNELHLSAAAEV